MRLGAGRKRGHLLVSHMNPADLLTSANRIGNTVEGVASDPVHSLNPRIHQDVYEHISHFFLSHNRFTSFASDAFNFEDRVCGGTYNSMELSQAGRTVLVTLIV